MFARLQELLGTEQDDRWLVAALTGLGALLRFATLGRAPADVDESWTWYLVHLAQSGRGFWQALALGVEGPLFASMNLAIGSRWEPSLLAFRVPQAVFGTLALPLAFVVLRRIATRELALLGTLLAALSPFLVHYSKQARPYAQLLFFCLLWLYADERTRARGGWRRYLALGLSAALAVATHYYALVFLGTVYLLRLAGHLLARRRADAWRELRDALATVAMLSPLLLIFVGQLSGLSMRYWQRDRLGLAAVWTEEFLLLGSSLGGAARAERINLTVAALVLAPFAWMLWRSPRRLLDRPLLLVGLAMPVLVTALLGRSNLFAPRGFIPSVPFLLAGWALATSQMPIGRWKRVYVGVLLVPFLLSTWAVATSDPRQGFLQGREIMPEIVARARSFESEYDLLLVHHWFLAQYAAIHHPHPDRVRGLGMDRRRSAARYGELAAIVGDLANVPRDARVLLMCNDLAAEVDPQDAVIAALRARRPLLREIPCRDEPVPGESLLCRRMLLFGAERPPGAEGR